MAGGSNGLTVGEDFCQGHRCPQWAVGRGAEGQRLCPVLVAAFYSPRDGAAAGELGCFLVFILACYLQMTSQSWYLLLLQKRQEGLGVTSVLPIQLWEAPAWETDLGCCPVLTSGCSLGKGVEPEQPKIPSKFLSILSGERH